MSAQAAAMVLGSITGVSILGRVGTGYLSDRVSVRYITITLFLLQTVGLVLLAATSSMVWLFAILFGLSLGGMAALEPLLVGRYFGLASFGKIIGSFWAVTTVGWAAGPTITGYIFDITGSYTPALLAFIITSLLAAALMLFLHPPPSSLTSHFQKE